MKTIIIIIILSCISGLSNAEDINADLFDAAKRGDVSTVESLLSKGASVGFKTNGELTPLHAASAYGHTKIVLLLIKKGANVNAIADQGVTPLHSSSINGHIGTAVALLNNGADVNVQDKRNGFSPLHWASWKGHQKVAELLIERGADVNLKMKQGQTPLMAAADHNNTSIIQLLLSKGADLEARKNDGQTVLMAAAFNGNIQMVQFLLSLGCNANAKNHKDSTALMGASYKGYSEIVDLLLANGADVNARESDGQTALMLAAYKGHLKIADTLISAGAEIKLKKQDGSTAINSAEEGGHREIVKLLKQRIMEESPEILLSPPKRWALIIGISKYSDTKIPSLRYASHDAQSFYDWIISPDGGKYPPSQVKLLLDQEATEKEIRSALFVWLAQSIEEDIVTIYFAGHGSPDSPDTPSNLFLLASDTQYENITTTGFPMWDIETALKRFIKAKKVIVITDACHAGGVGQSYDIARRAGRGITFVPISSSLQNLSKIGDGISIISASDDSQYSQESQKWGGGHGVFTYYLLRGLKGEADYSKDNSVSLGEIIPYLSEQVRRATKNAQTPTVAGRFDPALTIGK